ncbi:transmembrane protein 199 [Agrilus planipennis]|uniref:Transmembrane protein 199 n=1 Tax=Agrilus planipennis TaxID=224129 RepID=A0A1W4XR08_AGRPL|nr:transmembrane protein 199 [Agrilus planipennis]
MPLGISALNSKKSVDHTKRKQVNPVYHTSTEDKLFVKELNLQVDNICTDSITNGNLKQEYFLNLEDLYWIYHHLEERNKLKNSSDKMYFHELFEGSEILLPENEEIPRNKELEKRCQKLREQQENKEYKNITKDVDSIRRKLPEDTISYQLKQLNKQLIAVFQFVLSVAAGFAFGFIGIELIVGNLDFGFRLLLGIMCALIIALAELYFLAKKLNEDLQFDVTEKQKAKHSKID